MTPRVDPRATPDTLTAGSRRCGLCRRAKPLDCFHRNRSNPGGLAYRCKSCRRASDGAPDSPAKKAWSARPENRARRRERERARSATPAGRARVDRYRRSARGRLVAGRCKARGRLRRAETDAARARLSRLVAAYDAEIARNDRVRAGGLRPCPADH